MDSLSSLTLLTLAGLGVESYISTCARNKVPVRIHVNGTRGKSTTVRLVAAMCRAHHLHTVAKFTGGKPGFVDPDGAQHPWVRRGPARLAEQNRFWRRAAAFRAEAGVLECMAVDPYLQWVAEHTITKATHTVITNVRPDHFEVMGANLTEMASCLANTVPTNGQLILGDDTYYSIFTSAAQARGSRVSVVTETYRQALWKRLGCSLGWSRGFLENAATALTTAASLGIPELVSESVLLNWPKEQPFYTATWNGTKVYVVNALSANDPVSARAAWDLLPDGEQGVAIYAHRADRPLRLQAFLKDLATQIRCREILIAGPIANQYTLLRNWPRSFKNPMATAQQPSVPCISAVGTRAVHARLHNLIGSTNTPTWVLLLGNELGLPACLQELTQSGQDGTVASTNPFKQTSPNNPVYGKVDDAQ